MTCFDHLCAQLRIMKAAGLQDTDSYRRLCDLALENAPDQVMRAIMDAAVREGMLPPPMGIDSNGERLWKLEDVAKHFGLSPEEAKKSLDAYRLEHGEFQDIDRVMVHRVH